MSGTHAVPDMDFAFEVRPAASELSSVDDESRKNMGWKVWPFCSRSAAKRSSSNLSQPATPDTCHGQCLLSTSAQGISPDAGAALAPPHAHRHSAAYPARSPSMRGQRPTCEAPLPLLHCALFLRGSLQVSVDKRSRQFLPHYLPSAPVETSIFEHFICPEHPTSRAPKRCACFRHLYAAAARRRRWTQSVGTR